MLNGLSSWWYGTSTPSATTNQSLKSTIPPATESVTDSFSRTDEQPRIPTNALKPRTPVDTFAVLRNAIARLISKLSGAALAFMRTFERFVEAMSNSLRRKEPTRIALTPMSMLATQARVEELQQMVVESVAHKVKFERMCSENNLDDEDVETCRRLLKEHCQIFRDHFDLIRSNLKTAESQLAKLSEDNAEVQAGTAHR